MMRKSAILALAGAALIVLAGCGAPAAQLGAAAAQATSVQPGPGAASSAPSTSGTAAGSTPSAAAQMICGDETKTNLASSLALPGPPQSADSWSDQLYTCTYALPAGQLVLSVKESESPASARAYFDALQKTLGSAEAIEGLANLGLPAYKTADGNVVFVKDNMTLQVNGTGLTGTVGPHAVSRTELSFEVATAILGCWREH